MHGFGETSGAKALTEVKLCGLNVYHSYLFARAAVTKYPKQRGLNNRNLSSQFWRPDV